MSTTTNISINDNKVNDTTEYTMQDYLKEYREIAEYFGTKVSENFDEKGAIDGTYPSKRTPFGTIITKKDDTFDLNAIQNFDEDKYQKLLNLDIEDYKKISLYMNVNEIAKKLVQNKANGATEGITGIPSMEEVLNNATSIKKTDRNISCNSEDMNMIKESILQNIDYYSPNLIQNLNDYYKENNNPEIEKFPQLTDFQFYQAKEGWQGFMCNPTSEEINNDITRVNDLYSNSLKTMNRNLLRDDLKQDSQSHKINRQELREDWQQLKSNWKEMKEDFKKLRKNTKENTLPVETNNENGDVLNIDKPLETKKVSTPDTTLLIMNNTYSR